MPTNYRARVERAIRFIREHSAEPLRLRDVARAAALSEFHFHRIFASVMHESVGRFIARTRLERCAFRLAYEPDASISEIALESGFSSASNFSKAFSARFGCAPSRVRTPGTLPAAVVELVRRGARRVDPAALYALPREASAVERKRHAATLAKRVRFEQRAELPLACLASGNGYALAAIEAAWEELIERSRQLGLAREPFDAFGLSFDSPQLTRPDLCRYHACIVCPVDAELPPPLFRGRIPAGRYAVFPYAGAASAVEQVYRAIYSVWLPQSSLRPDDFAPIDHYVQGAPVRGQIELEIWIKVRAK